jgi:YbbR domain-containing protein
MRWLINNLPFKILSLVLSLILWLYVAGELERGLWWKNKKNTLKDVPIRVLVSQGNDFQVEISPEKADVVLSGYKNLENLDRNDIVLYVDLGDLQLGSYELPVQSIEPKELTIDRIVPSIVQVNIKEKLLKPASSPISQSGESLQE